jgi:hypothetical protein
VVKKSETPLFLSNLTLLDVVAPRVFGDANVAYPANLPRNSSVFEIRRLTGDNSLFSCRFVADPSALPRPPADGSGVRRRTRNSSALCQKTVDR